MMADAVTAAVGAVLMATFVLLIAVKLNEFPLWIVVLSGLVLMAAAFWTDAWRPLLRRSGR